MAEKTRAGNEMFEVISSSIGLTAENEMFSDISFSTGYSDSSINCLRIVVSEECVVAIELALSFRKNPGYVGVLGRSCGI